MKVKQDFTANNNYLLITNNDLEKVKQELQAEVESKNSELKALREDANASTNNQEIKSLKELNTERLKINNNLKAEVLNKNSAITTLKEKNN